MAVGGLIGILSTVILVSTVCTLIFAVGAYVVARGNRTGVNQGAAAGSLPGEDKIEDQFPRSGDGTGSQVESPLFRRVKPTGEAVSDASDDAGEYQWK